MKPRTRIETEFDPSDVDKSMQLAYRSLSLASYAVLAVHTDNQGLLMGRDQSSFLFQAALDVCVSLGLIEKSASAKEVDDLVKELTDL